MRRFPEVSVTATGMSVGVMDARSWILHINKHIIDIITLNTTRQVKPRLTDPDNEESRRKGRTLSTDRQSCHVQYTRDRLSDCTILP